MIQIEHIEGIRNIDSILKVNGIDSIFIGPYDLSASMGLTGQVDHPEVRTAIDLIKVKCREAGLPATMIGDVRRIRNLRGAVTDGANIGLTLDKDLQINANGEIVSRLPTGMSM